MSSLMDNSLSDSDEVLKIISKIKPMNKDLANVLNSIGISDSDSVYSSSIGAGYQFLTKVMDDNSKFGLNKERLDSTGIVDYVTKISSNGIDMFSGATIFNNVKSDFKPNEGTALGIFGNPMNPQFQFNLLDDIRYINDKSFDNSEQTLLKTSGRIYTEVIKKNWSIVHFQMGHDIYNTNILGFWQDTSIDMGSYIRGENTIGAVCKSAIMSMRALMSAAFNVATIGIFDKKFVSFKPRMALYWEYCDSLIFEMASQLGLVKFHHSADILEKKEEGKDAKVNDVPNQDTQSLPENKRWRMRHILGRNDIVAEENLRMECLPFLLNKSCTVSESWNNSTEEHPLSASINEKAMAQQQNDQNAAGGTNDGLIAGVANWMMKKGQKAAIQTLSGDMGQVVAGLGRISLPETWRDSKFSRSYSLNFKLFSPYGDVRSIFENVYIPMLCLMAMSTPRQINKVAYMAPFIIKAYAPGLFACDFGMVESMNIAKGEDKNQRSIHSLPRTINITISIKDLFPSFVLSMGRGANMFTHAKNTQLLDYMWILSGQSLAERERWGNSFDRFFTNVVESWQYGADNWFIDRVTDSSLFKTYVGVKRVLVGQTKEGTDRMHNIGAGPRTSNY